ncbi:hypothetical protein AB0H76_35430 [Nocardia sp. NPDC050712]|uniref:hypothetical protein n=1 Tax=Nocardia sp. NPDC050712 TaxID=3155518 RepID=UPI0034016A51
MRTTFRLTVASVAAATLVAAAAGAAAEPSALDPSPPSVGAVAEAGTGSAAVDSASNAARSAVWLLQQGNFIGLLVLLAVTPVQMLTGGVCDLATGSGLPTPCGPGAR